MIVERFHGYDCYYFEEYSFERKLIWFKELNINIISPIAELFEKQLSLDWESRGVRFF